MRGFENPTSNDGYVVTRNGSRQWLLVVKRGVCVKLEQRCVDEIAGGHAVYKCLVLPSNRTNLVRDNLQGLFDD